MQTVDQEHSSVDRFFRNSQSIDSWVPFGFGLARALAPSATCYLCVFRNFGIVVTINVTIVFCIIPYFVTFKLCQQGKKGRHEETRRVLYTVGCLMMTPTARQSLQHKKFSPFNNLLWRLAFFDDPPPHCRVIIRVRHTHNSL